VRAVQVEYEYFGELRTVELIPGGSRVAVTAANRGRYVEAYTRWMLQDSIADQFSAFRDGFQHVCGGPALGCDDSVKCTAGAVKGQAAGPQLRATNDSVAGSSL
jgi:HECT-domain (ubiquitin-transferase)